MLRKWNFVWESKKRKKWITHLDEKINKKINYVQLTVGLEEEFSSKVNEIILICYPYKIGKLKIENKN